MTDEERTLLLTTARVLRAYLSDMGHQDVQYLDEALKPFQGAGEGPDEYGASE